MKEWLKIDPRCPADKLTWATWRDIQIRSRLTKADIYDIFGFFSSCLAQVKDNILLTNRHLHPHMSSIEVRWYKKKDRS